MKTYIKPKFLVMQVEMSHAIQGTVNSDDVSKYPTQGIGGGTN